MSNITPDCVNNVSELEFDRMTDSLDKRAFKRKTVVDKIAKAAVILVLAAVALYLITYIPNCFIAQRTYDEIFGVWATGGIVIDGVYYDDLPAISRIAGVYLGRWDNKVVVYMSRIDEQAIAEFREIFPNARRVVFEYGERQYAMPT